MTILLLEQEFFNFKLTIRSFAQEGSSDRRLIPCTSTIVLTGQQYTPLVLFQI